VTVLRIQRGEFFNLLSVGLLKFPLKILTTNTCHGVAAVTFDERDVTCGTVNDGIVRVALILQTGYIIVGYCRASETMRG
jgi:hypothetical protein